MVIQYASDLHLEFADNWRFLKEHTFEVMGEILVLAGDIGYLGDENYSKHPFWDFVSENYREVLVVPGNHEFYKFYDIAKLKDGLLLEVRPNVKVFYNDVIRIGDVDIIMSTLWGRITLQDAFVTETGVTDFRRILYKDEHLTYDSFNREHERCMAFLKKACRESTATHQVIITHHLPSFQLQYEGFKGSRINGAFVADEDDFIESCGAEYWVYGHSHKNISKVIGRTQFVSNQLGYVFSGEHVHFKLSAVFQIGSPIG